MTEEEVNKAISDWKLITIRVVDLFAERYFPNAEQWQFLVDNSIGNIICVDGHYFNIDGVLLCLQYYITTDAVIEYFSIKGKNREDYKRLDLQYEECLKKRQTYI